MAIIGEHIIKLDSNGEAFIISFNVPDATGYNGRNYSGLCLPPLPPSDLSQPPLSFFKTSRVTIGYFLRYSMNRNLSQTNVTRLSPETLNKSELALRGDMI